MESSGHDKGYDRVAGVERVRYMDKEILKNKALSLPIFYSEDKCENVLLNKIGQYFDLLYRDNSCSVFTREAVDTFKKKIKKMFQEYYLGHQNKAYEQFKSALDYLIKDIGLVTSLLPKESLYRARLNDTNQDYRDEEMFHIKYDLRSKVKTQRFSFPGLPCLYLGTSSYVCWLELNRPSFDQFQVATIKQKDLNCDHEVIDLCIHPLSFYNELIDREKGNATEHQNLCLESYLKWWPVMACCSVAVKNEDDPFKPEYIFPQFMLQYLLEERNEFVGIKYMSIKAGRISMRQYETDFRTYTNYVIPTKSEKETEKGFCRILSEQFEIAKNISGRELQVVSDMARENGITWHIIGEDDKKQPLDLARIYGTNDTEYSYEKSIFRRIENILDTDGEKLNQILKKPQLGFEIDKAISAE